MFMNKQNLRNYAPTDFVAAILLVKGNIFYAYYDQKKQELINFYNEPYEEALEVVRAERPDLLTHEGFESILRGEICVE